MVLGWSLLVTACTSPAARTTSQNGPASPTAPASSLPPGDRVRVDRVVDGDTVIVGGERVRLIGMNAPESVKPDSPVECYGPESSAALMRLLPRRTPVLLEYDVDRYDRYGRTLAYVWLTDPPRLVNVELVRQGFASVATYPPDVAHLGELEAAEHDARLHRRGVWQMCS